MIMASSPEAAILATVEQYIHFTEQGWTTDAIIRALNRMQGSAMSLTGGELPQIAPPYTLERYLEHLLRYAQPEGIQVESAFIPTAIREIRSFYGR